MKTREISALLLLLVFWLAAFDSVEADEDKRLLSLADRERFKHPGRPAIAPNGEDIAFSLDNRVYVVREGDAEPRAVTGAGSAWSPVWSADGSALYFLSDRRDGTQLWRLAKERFGEAEQVSTLEQGVSAIRLSPDETRLLLVFADKALAPAAESREGPPPPFVVTRRQFKRDAGQGYLTDGDRRHIYMLDLGENELTPVTSGRYEESDPAWSSDGERIVFVSNREADPDASYRTDIWLTPVGGDRQVTQLTDNARTKHSPAFSPDGEHVAYITAEDGVYGVQHIGYVAVAGGEPRLLTANLDRWVSAFQFSSDGRFIYFTFDDAGSSLLGRVRVSDGNIDRLLTDDVSVSAFDVSRRDVLALNMSGRNDTTDVYRMRGRNPQRLTDLNAALLAELEVGAKQKVSFESKDGTIVEAFITTPPGYERGRPYPTILNIHGGPVGQFAWGYNFPAQYYAANGYVVVEPNPRGSTGFGQDYIRAIYRTWGITDYDDVIAAVDYAIEEGIADPERLAVTGYSYGGYLTNVVITNSDRFRAAASGAGHSLIEANFGHDIYQQWYVWELGVPWENRERYDRLSPFLRAGNISTPTIFLGGRIDWNVPVLNAELMYQAMKVRGIDAELIVYPDAHHGGWPVEYDNDYLERIVGWFDRYVD